MNALTRWLVRQPLVFLVAHAAVTVTLAVCALGVRIDSSLENFLPAADPQVRYYNEVRATFGSDDAAVIGVRADDLFAPQTLEKIARVTSAVAAIQGVEQVLSITNAPDPAADVITPPRLLPRLPPSPEDIATLKAKLTARPLYGKNLVADDFRAAAINVFFESLTGAEYRDLDIEGEIERILDAQGGPEEFFYTGAAHIREATVDLMRSDLRLFTPISLAVIVCVLWLSFRSVRAVVLSLLAVGVALVWTLGVMGLIGQPITLGTSILPPLLQVVGSAYAIHVVTTYRQQLAAGTSQGELVERTLQQVASPLLLSALATGVGFGSLMGSRIGAIRDLGTYAVLGLLCVTVTSLTFLPAMLQLVGGRVSAAETAGDTWLSQMLTRFGQRAYGSRRTILWAAAAIGLAALLGARFVRVDSNFIAYFKPGSEVRRSNEIINREIVGSNPFYLVIEASEPGQLKHWEVLKKIKELQEFLNTLPGITTTVSLVDWLELLEAGLTQGAKGDLIIDEQGRLVEEETPKPFWEEPRNLGPVLSMISASPKTFASFVNKDFTKASVLVRTRMSGSNEIERTLASIRDYIAQNFPANLDVQPTGSLVLLTGTSSGLVAGQIASLSLALGTIFIVFALMFLSVRVGLLAIVPNVLPIVIFFGVLGWLGINLDLGTSLIAAVALGLLVNATIHYMARLNLELKGETDQAAAVVRTIRAVGVPITYTTVALFLGFLTFVLSSFVPIQNFGVLTSVTMATAFGCNVLLLPALLATTKIITLWDLVGVRLGEDPARTIPLLSGLRPAQARIVVLMGELQRFAPGEVIVRRGEHGDSMYVIIQGKTEVWAGGGPERHRLAEMGRGEVFGEMALVRRHERSADVVAAEPVEVLTVNQRFLSRIQSRYPRIAAKVFLNLTRILSNRLEEANERFAALRARSS